MPCRMFDWLLHGLALNSLIRSTYTLCYSNYPISRRKQDQGMVCTEYIIVCTEGVWLLLNLKYLCCPNRLRLKRGV